MYEPKGGEWIIFIASALDLWRRMLWWQRIAPLMRFSQMIEALVWRPRLGQHGLSNAALEGNNARIRGISQRTHGYRNPGSRGEGDAVTTGAPALLRSRARRRRHRGRPSTHDSAGNRAAKSRRDRRRAWHVPWAPGGSFEYARPRSRSEKRREVLDGDPAQLETAVRVEGFGLEPGKGELSGAPQVGLEAARPVVPVGSEPAREAFLPGRWQL
jgi:hypothetical protein